MVFADVASGVHRVCPTSEFKFRARGIYAMHAVNPTDDKNVVCPQLILAETGAVVRQILVFFGIVFAVQ